MAQFSTYMTAQERFIADLQKDIEGLRATVREKDDTIRDLGRQLVEKDSDHNLRVKLLEIDLKCARDLADLHNAFFKAAIQPQ